MLIVQILYFTLSSLVVNYAANSLFKLKTNEKKVILSIFIYVASFVLLKFINFQNILNIDLQYFDFVLKTTILILFQMYLISKNYKVTLIHNFIFASVCFIVFVISIFLSDNLYFDLVHIFGIETINALIIFSIVTNIISFLIWFLLVKIIKNALQTHSILSFLPLGLSFLTLIAVVALSRLNTSNITNLSLVIIIILTNYLIIYLYAKSIRISQLKNTKIQMDAKLKYYNDRLELQNSHYNRSFKFIHDLIYKIKDIREDVKNKNYGNLDDKIDTLYSKLLKEFNIVFTISKTISVAINNNLEAISSNNIAIKTTLKYSDFTFMSDIESTEMFDILLKYGISSTKVINNDYKFINLSTYLRHSNIIIKIMFSGNYELCHNNLLDNLSTIIKKYDGEIFKQYDEVDEYSSISIMFDIDTINKFKSLENTKRSLI